MSEVIVSSAQYRLLQELIKESPPKFSLVAHRSRRSGVPPQLSDRWRVEQAITYSTSRNPFVFLVHSSREGKRIRRLLIKAGARRGQVKISVRASGRMEWKQKAPDGKLNTVMVDEWGDMK